MLMPRTIRLDTTDVQAFDHAAEPGEWAVSGAFAFSDLAEEDLVGKVRVAFRSAFLGIGSFGWSTFVAVAQMSELEHEATLATLTQHLLDIYGAPDLAAAGEAASQEMLFASGLCAGYQTNQLIGVERELNSDGISEGFRTFEPPREAQHARIWDIVPEVNK